MGSSWLQKWLGIKTRIFQESETGELESSSWSRGVKGDWFSWALSALLRGANVGHQLVKRLHPNSKHAEADLFYILFSFL